MTAPREILRRWFPDVGGFRDRQEDAIVRLLGGASLLLLMPTGGGKSLVYQLPVLAKCGIGLVISPLIALMREHAQRLSEMGVPALAIGGLEPREAQEALRNFSWCDGPAFLFTSPERTETDGFLEYLLHLYRERVALVAIDEAHCVSQWGHDFRPSYKALPRFFDRAFGRGTWPAVACLTATLDRHNEAEILADFRLGADDVIRSPRMMRENITMSCETFPSTDAKQNRLTELLEKHRDKKVIVYAHLKHNKQAGTRSLAESLAEQGHAAAPFDADLPLEERDRVLNAFTDGEIRVVCATSAFGMGIDIPDIRGVIHFLPPESFEQYYQEVGRAGRDGAASFATLLYTPKNAKVREDQIKSGRVDAEAVKRLWDGLIAPGRTSLRSITPAVDLQGHDDDNALFHAFERLGALEVIARGPSRIDAYEARGPDGTLFLRRLQESTRIGNFFAAFRKLGIDPAEGYRQLFELYACGEVRLIRSPQGSLVIRVNELSPENATRLAVETDERIDKRLRDFLAFKSGIEDGGSLDAALRMRFALADN